MIYVNDDHYSREYFSARFAYYDTLPFLHHCQGQRLAVCLTDTAEWIALCLFIKQKGGSVFPIHAATPQEAARRSALRAECHQLLFHDIDNPLAIQSRGPDSAGVLVQMSSGTTGEPKTIARTWESIDEEIESYVTSFTLPASMTPVVACPVTHSYGLICGVLVALTRGVEPVIITQINPKYLIRKLMSCPAHLLYGSPTLFNTLCQLLPAGSNLHAVMTSGAVLPRPWFQSLQQKTQFLFQQYGCSEAGCVAIAQSVQAANEMGQALPHVQLSAGTGSDAPAEIVVTKNGEPVFTQDLGYLNEQGRLFFVARLDDTINVAGLNVYPQEVEDVLLDYPLITDVVVFKKQDAYAGERASLKFVAREAVDFNHLRAWCAKHLAPHQVPHDFEQVAEIPRLPNGKINRKSLAQAPVMVPA